MKHFVDYAQHVSNQTFSAAAIVDGRGKQCGRVVVRFTNSQIGYNHQVGVIFWPADIGYGETVKGSTYDQPKTLVKHIQNHGAICLNWHKQKIENNGDSLSRFDEVCYIKYKRRIYRLLWVM